MLLLCSCLFGIFISHSGASVSLMIKDGVSSFQDGSKVVLICTISPYNNVMTWLVNNDPYADCFKGSCGASSNKPFTFIFNFDESNGEFRLTIESVNTSHAGQLFSCDDGSERKTITFNVTTRVEQSEPSDSLCSIFKKDRDCIVLIIICPLAAIAMAAFITVLYTKKKKLLVHTDVESNINQDRQLAGDIDQGLTSGDPNRSLQRLDNTSTHYIHGQEITSDYTNRMTDDTNRGRIYNQLVVNNESITNEDDFNRFQQNKALTTNNDDDGFSDISK